VGPPLSPGRSPPLCTLAFEQAVVDFGFATPTSPVASGLRSVQVSNGLPSTETAWVLPTTVTSWW
jgi:hypothetical protein